MKRRAALLATAIAIGACLSGCAHMEKKAPCSPDGVFGAWLRHALEIVAQSGDCGPLRPIN